MQKNGWFKKCDFKGCENKIYVTPSQIRQGRGKYCSTSCKGKVVVYAMLKVRGKEWKKKAQKNMDRLQNSYKGDETKHPRWKGDDVGYYGIHDWLTKHYGQPKFCESCGLNDEDRVYHWCNLSGDYNRTRKDFLRMCVSCHRKYDYAGKKQK